MATYGNTGGNGLNINVYSGSGGNLSEWALDYDGMKLLTIPEVITASNITTNQAVTVTLKAKPIFTNITVSFFRVKFPDGTIAEYPATNNSAVFTTTVTVPLGSQQSLLVYARDNSGNRSAVAQHQYTIINSNPPSTNTITHNIPSNFNAGDVKQIQISGAVDPEGGAYTYTLILPEEISGSKISGIANNEAVTLTVQNTIQYTKMDKIIIRVTDINGAQNDKVLDITMLSGGSSGGTNNFNVRTSFPSSVYQNEVFAAKIWELGTNNYTYGLNLPNGITSSKTTGILSNENFTITIAPSVIPNSTVSIDVVVYTGSVSVGSFVVNMLVDGVTGEMSYTTPGTYEFTVPNSVNSVSMLQVYSDEVISDDLSDKNVVVDHTVPNMSFDKVVLSGDTFIAYNGMDKNIYRCTAGSNVWELLSAIPKFGVGDTVYIQVFKPNIVVIYTSYRLWYSDNSGVTWVSHPINNCNYVVIHKNSVYYLSSVGHVSRLNHMTGDIEVFGPVTITVNYMYSLGDVLIATSNSEVYYYDEYDHNLTTAFKNITAQYSHKFPMMSSSRRFTNVSSKYIHGSNTPAPYISIYNEEIKTITRNNLLDNPSLTSNILTSSNMTVADVCYADRIYIHDDFFIFITNYVLSVSTDVGKTFTSIYTGAVVVDVVAHNGVLYIFSGNKVKKIVPSIMDNSNIINKDPNTGYSLVNPKQTGNFGKNGYAKYLNNIEVTPGEKIKINVTSPDGGVRLVWGTNRYFPTNAS